MGLYDLDPVLLHLSAGLHLPVFTVRVADANMLTHYWCALLLYTCQHYQLQFYVYQCQHFDSIGDVLTGFVIQPA